MSKRIIKKNSGEENIQFCTKMSRYPVANGYQRVVISDHGAYIEFTEDQIEKGSLYVPRYAVYRLSSKLVYFIEYRTKKDDVMVYLQKRKVKYSDYKEGYYYIDPKYLSIDGLDIVIDLEIEDPNQKRIDEFQ